ncbi:MAG: hypothetical protein R6V49_10825 [Bacteroidales bacterium]
MEQKGGKMRNLVHLVFLLLIFAGCSKTGEYNWDAQYRYFPMEEGHWVVYEVDSTAYNKLQDTVIRYHYFVRQTIGTTFTDLSGQTWRRVDHEVSPDSLGGWTITAASARKITRRNAETLEDNLRVIRLTFPFKKFTYWHGNSQINYEDPFNCNFYGDWQFQFRELFVPQTVSGLNFDSVVTVQQVADSGLICKSFVNEMYAPGVGLIYKHVERLTTQNTGSDPFYIKAEDGYILTYRIVNWKRD